MLSKFLGWWQIQPHSRVSSVLDLEYFGSESVVPEAIFVSFSGYKWNANEMLMNAKVLI